MSNLACPLCTMTDVLVNASRYECVTCGHEWENASDPAEASSSSDSAAGPRVVKDAHGAVLVDGDTVTLIKDLKLKGSSQVLKQGTKAKNIRLVEGDHEISCKIDGSSMGLKACFVKKA